MRILVAGWHGQIALALSEAAARRSDITAYAVGRPALDLTDRPSIGRTLFGIAPDVIINTAAYTDVEGAQREPAIAFRRNTEGAAALAVQAARIGVPIIHLSTVYVFDGQKAAPYAEDDPTGPINVYGSSKRHGEAAVRASNPQHVIVRTGWVYSPFGRNFVSSIREKASLERVLTVDDGQRGSPTYAPHLASAILDLAAVLVSKRCGDYWGTYHIADRGFASWLDMAREIIRTSADGGDNLAAIVPGDPTGGTGGARRPQNAMLDCGKLENVFGIRMPSWRDGISDCVMRLSGKPLRTDK